MRQVLSYIFPYLPFTEFLFAFSCFAALMYPEVFVQFDPYFLEDLGFLLCGEFIFCHSGVFLGVLLGPGHKSFPLIPRIGLMAFLLLIYTGFILSISTGLIIPYLVLTGSRVAGSFTDSDEVRSKELLKTVLRTFFYLVTAIFALMIGSFGISPEVSGVVVRSTGGDVTSQQFLSWGFYFYFLNGVMAVIVNYFSAKSLKHNAPDKESAQSLQ